MGYVAVKGGAAAIENAEKFSLARRAGGASALLKPEQIREQLYLAVDRVMGEGGLYAPDLPLWLSNSRPGIPSRRLSCSAPSGPLSSVWAIPCRSHRKDAHCPANFLGLQGYPRRPDPRATSDYTLRLLDSSCKMTRAAPAALPAAVQDCRGGPGHLPKVIGILRREGLLAEALARGQRKRSVFDITRQHSTFPAARSATLQALARGETGGMLALAYSSMRGYGNIHPTLGELRVGYLPLVLIRDRSTLCRR